MKVSHIHVNVRDLKAAVEWMHRALGARPVFENERMAVIPLNGLSIIFDQADEDANVTIAFDSQDCAKDYEAIAARDIAKVIEPPARKPWGVVVAYLAGPGRVTFEIEQVLAES